MGSVISNFRSLSQMAPGQPRENRPGWRWHEPDNRPPKVKLCSGELQFKVRSEKRSNLKIENLTSNVDLHAG